MNDEMKMNSAKINKVAPINEKSSKKEKKKK